MFNKFILTNRLVNFLIKNDFEVFVSHGCFNIAARREKLLLIKTLFNVDGLNEEQALSLRTMSYFLSAYPFVVSVKTNREFLKDDVIYSRFDLPVLTSKLFEKMLEANDVLVMYSTKGKCVANIDVSALKRERKKLKLSLSKLSEMVGISKKALYEIENKKVNPTVKTVKKLEYLFGVNLVLPYEMKAVERAYLKSKNRLQHKISEEFSRIGIDNSPIYFAPFEIVGKEKFPIITSILENVDKVHNEVKIIKNLSSIFSSKSVFVTRKSKEESIEGVPIFLESELHEIESSDELEKMIEERINK